MEASHDPEVVSLESTVLRPPAGNYLFRPVNVYCLVLLDSVFFTVTQAPGLYTGVVSDTLCAPKEVQKNMSPSTNVYKLKQNICSGMKSNGINFHDALAAQTLSETFCIRNTASTQFYHTTRVHTLSLLTCLYFPHAFSFGSMASPAGTS